jgi:hypothetical protein
MEEIKNKMRRAAINNYKRKSESLIYYKGSEAEKDAIVFFKDHLEKIENDNGNVYFTERTPFSHIPFWNEIDPTEKKEEINLLEDIINELIPMSSITCFVDNTFYVAIPTDKTIDEKINILEQQVSKITAELAQWKRLKME